MDMRKLYVLALASCLSAFTCSLITAQEKPAPQGPPPEVYSGKVMAVSGVLAGKPTDVAVVIGGYTQRENLQRYEQILHGKEGQARLAEALNNENDLGAYRLGTDLALAVKLITQEKTDKGRHVFLVGTRIPQGRELQGKLGPRDYRFVVIELNLNAAGNGSGSYVSSAKLRFNKEGHYPEVDDYQTLPANIENVKAESPR
jgi:hypothetical protein